MIETPTLLQEVYKTYQVEPNTGSDTGEVIKYYMENLEWNELKCYRIMKRLFELGIRLDIDKQTEYFISAQPNPESNMSSFIFTEEDKSLEDCMLKVLITLHDEIPGHSQLEIRNTLKETY